MDGLQDFRMKRIKKSMEDAGADILVATMPSNLSYLTGGYVSVMQSAIQHAECAVGYVPEEDALFYVVGYSELPTVFEFAGLSAEVYVTGGRFCFEKDEACKDGFAESVMTYQNQAYDTTAEAWAAAVKAHRKPGAVVAVDEGRIFPSLLDAVKRELPEYRFAGGNAIFKEARRIKHPDEIMGIRKAAVTASEALMEMLSRFRPGMTEYEMYRDYNLELTKRGAIPCYGVITAGKRAAYSDTVSDRTRKILPGEMVRFDFGCFLDGYCSDLARTAYVGEPDEKTALYYRAVREGCLAAAEKMRPGALCGDIFETAVEMVRSAGIPHYRRHHCGHGIGLEMYDLYSIAPGSEDVVEEQMTFCVETPYYELGWGGVQLEHTLAVTKDGYEYLDKTEDGLILLG